MMIVKRLLALIALVAFLPLAADATPIQYRNADGINDTSVTALTPLPTTLKSNTGIAAGLPTYNYISTFFTPVATGHDVATVCGSASKTVVVFTFTARMQSTSATLVKILFEKRSAVTTGGTPSALTAVPLDSAFGAATAVVNTYVSGTSTDPTPGTSLGSIAEAWVVDATTTAAPISYSLYLAMAAASAISYVAPIVLHGAAECIALNNQGAAWPAGTVVEINVQTMEY